MLTSKQIKAARIFLGINQEELAKISDLAIGTIKILETDQTSVENANQKTIRKIKIALESRGIKFLSPSQDDSIDGIGVRYFPSEDKETKTK